MSVKKNKKFPHPDPEFRALLDKISERTGEGRGNYSVDRHQQPMPDIDTILKEAELLEKTEQASSSTVEPVLQATAQRKRVIRTRTAAELRSCRSFQK